MPDRRPSERRLLALGLAFSGLIHVLLLLISPSFIGLHPPGRRPSAPGPDAVASRQAMRVYALLPVAVEAPSVHAVLEQVERDEPRRPSLPEAERAKRPAGTAATGESAADIGTRPTSAAKRLAPELRHASLWVIPDRVIAEELLAEKADVERVRERVYGRLEGLNDSVRVAQEAARGALDWTFSDGDGKRWGVSPDCIHLGRLALPRVVRTGHGLCESSPRAEYFREWDVINSHVERARVRDQFNERVKAVREHKEKERTRRTGTGDGWNRA